MAVLSYWHAETGAIDVTGPQNPLNTAFAPADQYKFISLDSTTPSVLDLCPSGTLPFGILQNLEVQIGQTTSAVGSYVSVRVGGLSQMLISGTVTAGNFLKADSSTGAGIACTTDKDLYGAIALQSGVSGDFIDVIIAFGFYVTA